MSKLGKEGHNGHFRICFNENNAKKGIVLSLTSLKGSKNVNLGRVDPVAKKMEISLEREKLLSKNTGDPTVGSLWVKKGN